MSGTQDQTSSTKKKRVVFTEDETHALLAIWPSEEIQHKFTTLLRHNLIWNLIAQLHRSKGYSKSGAEVKSKINNLKTEYRNIKPKSGSATSTWPFFKVINKILGERACADDSLLDDSMSPSQAHGDDFESNLMDNMPDGEEFSIDNCSNSDVVDESEGNTLDGSVESHINTTGKQAARQTAIMKQSCGKRQQVMRKIARPPRRKGSDENQLIKTLIEAENRYSQRLAVIEEQEKKAQEREDVLAQSMNRFLIAFAVLAEKSANLDTTLFGAPAPSMATSQRAAQGNSSATSLAPHTITSDSVGARDKPKKECTVSQNKRANLDYPNRSHSTLLPSTSCATNIAGIDDEMLEEYETQDKYVDSNDFADNSQIANLGSQFAEFDFNGANRDVRLQDLIDDEILPAVPWLPSPKPNIKIHSIKQLVGKDALDVNNLQPMKEITATYPLKNILEPLKPLKYTAAKLDNSQELATGANNPVTTTTSRCNTQQLLGKRIHEIENPQPTKKIIPQSLQCAPPQTKSLAKLIHLKKVVQTDKLTHHAENPPLDTGNVLTNTHKTAPMKTKKGFIYITLAKNQ